VCDELILIDPIPKDSAQATISEMTNGRHIQLHGSEVLNKSIELPTTIILPGMSPTSGSRELKAYREHQERDIHRFPDRREIIAGRSKNDILLARPDVVIDAIQRGLKRIGVAE
jgi:hypothetical protein